MSLQLLFLMLSRELAFAKLVLHWSRLCGWSFMARILLF